MPGKDTLYRAREYITWNDQASLQCCAMGPCGAGRERARTHTGAGTLSPLSSPFQSLFSSLLFTSSFSVPIPPSSSPSPPLPFSPSLPPPPHLLLSPTEWDEIRSTWAADSPTANQVRGGNGDQFRHGIEKGASLPVFVDQMFRSVFRFRMCACVWTVCVSVWE